MKRPAEIAVLKAEWEAAEHAARHAACLASEAAQAHDCDPARSLPSELAATAEELHALANEKRHTYFEAIAQSLLCAQRQEQDRRKGKGSSESPSGEG